MSYDFVAYHIIRLVPASSKKTNSFCSIVHVYIQATALSDLKREIEDLSMKNANITTRMDALLEEKGEIAQELVQRNIRTTARV